MNNLLQLHAFRQALYQKLGPARDALFELGDAVLTTPKVPSFAHLSLSPLFRRQWPSLYEALDDGRPDAQALMPLILDHLSASAFDDPILIGDHTPWARLSARTLPDRTYSRRGPRPMRRSKSRMRSTARCSSRPGMVGTLKRRPSAR